MTAEQWIALAFWSWAVAGAALFFCACSVIGLFVSATDRTVTGQSKRAVRLQEEHWYGDAA